jgi:hypothetical protein
VTARAPVRRCARCGHPTRADRMVRGYGRDCAALLGLTGRTVDTGHAGPDLLDLLAPARPQPPRPGPAEPAPAAAARGDPQPGEPQPGEPQAGEPQAGEPTAGEPEDQWDGGDRPADAP